MNSFANPVQNEQSTQSATGADRRRFQRINVQLSGRFMRENHQEFFCEIFEMSPGSAALKSDIHPEMGELIIAYIDHVGRIVGNVARLLTTGFVIQFETTAHKRDKLASQLTWLANRSEIGLEDDRRHKRKEPTRSHTMLVLPDGREYECKVKDISLSGAAVKLDIRPAIGTPVTMGKMRARVVRHIEDGIAMEFSKVLNGSPTAPL